MARPKKKSDSEVLRDALEVIIKNGPLSFTLAQVGKRTRLSPAALIKRFKDKETLLVRALEQSNLDWSEGLQSRQECEQKGLQGLLRFCARLSDAIEPRHMGEHLQLLAKDVDHPKLNRLTRHRLKFIRERILDYLKEASASGELRGKGDLEEMAFSLEATWHGAIIQWAFYREGSLSSWVHKRLSHQILA